MSTERERLLKDVQCLDFAAHEAALFLDINPDNAEALKYREGIAKQAATTRLHYEMRYGPLTQGACNHADKWRWVDAPWPWEYTGQSNSRNNTKGGKK